MINTGLFIREDNCLYDAIYFLLSRTNLKYVIVADFANINNDILVLLNQNNVIVLDHNNFIKRIKKSTIEGIDYLFSYYYQKRLEPEILNFSNFGCINFHPAPLPKYRGVGNYCKCILEDLNYWGVSAHFMDENFDNGEIIEVVKFNVNSKEHTYRSLEKVTQKYMLQLFRSVVERALNNNLKMKYIEINDKDISYLSRSKIKEMKLINDNDSLDEISKKIRAFWSPPFQGATLIINDKEFTIVDDGILLEIEKLYKKGEDK